MLAEHFPEKTIGQLPNCGPARPPAFAASCAGIAPPPARYRFSPTADWASTEQLIAKNADPTFRNSLPDRERQEGLAADSCVSGGHLSREMSRLTVSP